MDTGGSAPDSSTAPAVPRENGENENNIFE
jgi:hypothetical protein